MNPDQRALELFEAAIDQNEPESWLRSACGDDHRLLAEVLALLKADGDAAAFLAQPIGFECQREGQTLGHYRLLRRIGDGGMGTVYLAELTEHAAAPVALKLLRFDAPDLRQRFALEKRILASLDHPAIAQLLDAGSSDGAPYLVLEYVEGVPLTEYARGAGLSTSARLVLMIEVLAAVQYAHGRLVLHRDLKPSNVLIAANGRPKLLDFGIAKLLGAGERGLTLTGPGPMTPEYASPEQVRGLPLDTSSDIYALGVVLYELLTGKRPYDLSRATPSEIERTICLQMPAQPSALMPRLPRDLDHIVAKALAKSPQDRYRSCAEFAEDLQRHLDGLPVRARAATFSYRASRFVYRHRLGLLITLAVFVAMASLTAVAVRNAWRAEQATLDAMSERDSAREIQSWLQRMLEAADPRVLGHAPSAAELLDQAAATLTGGLHQRPEIERSLRLTLAAAYHGLGLDEQAEREAALAVALLSAQTSTTGFAATLRIRAQMQSELGDYEHALASLRRSLSSIESTAGNEAELEKARGLALRAFILSRQGVTEKAQADYDSALSLYAKIDADAAEHAEVLNNLAVLIGAQGQHSRALALHQQAEARLRAALGSDHPYTLLASVNGASALESMGQIDAAEAAYRQLLPPLQAALGDGHPEAIRVDATLGYLLANHGKALEAVDLMHQVVAQARISLPRGHPMRAYAESILGGALLEIGRPTEALDPLQQALSSRHESLPAGHPLLLASECALLEARARTGKASAVQGMRDLLAKGDADLGVDHPMVLRCRQRLEGL